MDSFDSVLTSSKSGPCECLSSHNLGMISISLLRNYMEAGGESCTELSVWSEAMYECNAVFGSQRYAFA